MKTINLIKYGFSRGYVSDESIAYGTKPSWHYESAVELLRKAGVR